MQRPIDAGENGVQLLIQGAGVPGDAGQEDEAAGDDVAWRDNGWMVLLHGLLDGAPHGPQVHGDGTRRVEVSRGDVARAGGAGLPREELDALPTAAVARCPIPTPEAGADSVVKGQTVGVQLGGEVGEEVAGRLGGRQAGAAFAGDSDELVAEGWVERRSHSFSSAGAQHKCLLSGYSTWYTVRGLHVDPHMCRVPGCCGMLATSRIHRSASFFRHFCGGYRVQSVITRHV
jgi:hypothetical protein